MNNFIKNGVQVLLYVLFAFPLLKISIVNLIIILLILFCLIYNPKQVLKFFIWENLKFTIPFWIISVTSVLYFRQEGWHDAIQNALPFLIYPFTFYLIPKKFFDSNLIERYFLITKVSCLIILITFISTFIYHYSLEDFLKIDYQISKFREFTYNETPFFKIHPTYYTLLLVFLVGDSFKNILTKTTFFDLIFVILSYLITFLLLSKLTVVVLILITVIFLFKKMNFSFQNKIIISAVFLSVIVFTALKIPGMYERFREVYLSFNNPPKGVAHDSTNVRLALYSCDINIIKDNIVTGVGFHNIKEQINSCLENNYDSSFYKNSFFLTHNYFIYMIAGAGIFGFTLFLLYLFLLIKKAKEIKNNGLFLLLTCVILGCLTEDYLYRNFGAFFLHVYFFLYLNNHMWVRSIKEQ